MCALATDRSAFATQQDIDTLVAVTHPRLGSLLDAPGQWRIEDFAHRLVRQSGTGLAHHAASPPLADPVSTLQKADERMSLHRPQSLFFLNDVLKHHLVQVQIRDQLLELAVLLLELPQPVQLGYAQTAVLLLPVLERSLGNSHPPARLADRCTALGLTQGKRNLLFSELRLLHGKTTSLLGFGFVEFLYF
jgi:hypothetical protein